MNKVVQMLEYGEELWMWTQTDTWILARDFISVRACLLWDFPIHQPLKALDSSSEVWEWSLLQLCQRGRGPVACAGQLVLDTGAAAGHVGWAWVQDQDSSRHSVPDSCVSLDKCLPTLNL